METMAATDVNNVVVKQEPVDDPASPNAEENNNSGSSSRCIRHNNATSNKNKGCSGETTVAKETKTSDDCESNLQSSHTASSPLRYISRRGRPPGGGYSMKSAHSHYVSFGQSPVGTTGSHDFLRQSSLGSAGSPQDLLKNGLDSTSSLDSLDARRFGLHCFEGDKNAFRCDGCDVVFGSRDTYAMHMLLRAKNESCVALPTSAISANPENPTPREKFERELREKAMISAIRSQAALMSKAAMAAAAVTPRNSSVADSVIQSLTRSPTSSKEDLNSFGNSDLTAGLNSLFAFDSYGLYMDQRQYRRLLSEYSFRAASSPGAITAMMEQLSCSVCGEVFTNKDSLAMHMMFHTRDEDGDTKPPVIPSWKSDTSSSLSKIIPLTVNTDNAGSRSSRKQDNPLKNEGERQLTVERIEELKRMAIESSLKSSLRKYPNNGERNPRPKSVSEDTVVTSSAQTRPLSADDAFKLSHSSEKGLYKPHKMIFKAYHREKENDSDYNENEDDNASEKIRDSTDTSRIPLRKRTLSISDDYLTNLYKRQRHFYSDNDVRSIAFRYDNLKSSISGDVSFPKVCDNHVSSASGPQDSDETSNGSSNTAMESTRVLDFGKSARDVESSSSPLENIMSGDTILIPVENPEDLQVNEDNSDFPRVRTALDREGTATAIDFTVEKSGLTMNSSDEIRNSVHTSPTNSESRMFDQRKNSERGLSVSEDAVSDDTTRREQQQQQQHQHHVELVTDGSQSATDIKDSSGRRSYDVSSESSRVGEARYCPHCEILFLDVTLFHLHMGLHNVNNPWQCNICGLACGGRLEFNTHVLHY